jgi:dTDP-4-dehydrorhamnose reductase
LRVLVLGAKGQLARALCDAAPIADAEVTARGRPDLDILRKETIVSAVADVRPDVVINAAAYTAVDAAERNVDLAYAVNAAGAADAAAAAAQGGVPLIQISTDYVFDGTKGSPYVETDVACPPNVYGASKYAGEIEVAKRLAQHVILRTSWVFAPQGHNFVNAILRLARDRPVLRVVDDQRGCPSSAGDVARGVLAVAARITGADRSAAWGVFHMAATGGATRHEFARAIVDMARPLGGPDARIETARTNEFPRPARRPADARLDCSKLERAYGVRLPHWTEGLERCLTAIADRGWRTS